MKGIKKISLWGSLAIGVLTLWSAVSIYSKVTDGFNTRQIASSLPSYFFFETCGDGASLDTVFEQPFTYVGKGCQSYVFKSQDDKYVIKFFKHKHLRTLHWLRKLPVPSSWVEKRIQRRDERIARIFASHQLSYEKFSDESGVVFVHLNQKPFIQRHITLIDKLGLPQPIYLDEFQFVIQKRAIPLSQVLKNTKDSLEIRTTIDQVCNALLKRMRKGVADRDPAVMNNMAVIPDEDKLLFIDVGQLYLEEAKSEEEMYKELAYRLNDMSAWADNHAPHVVPYLREKSETMNRSFH